MVIRKPPSGQSDSMKAGNSGFRAHPLSENDFGRVRCEYRYLLVIYESIRCVDLFFIPFCLGQPSRPTEGQMSQRGLQLRKRSDSLNETNIRRGSCADGTLNGLTDGFQKFTVKWVSILLAYRSKGDREYWSFRIHNERPTAKHVQVLPVNSMDKKPPIQKDEVRGGYRLLDRFLTSIGFWRSSSLDGEILLLIASNVLLRYANFSESSYFTFAGDDSTGRQSATTDMNGYPSLPKSILEETETVLDYHKMGIFWNIDLESAHADFLVDIIRYTLSIQACYPSTTKADWDALGGYRTFGLTNIFIIEIFYSQRLPTEVLPLAAYLVAVTVSRHSWQWKFAKFASQLACCQIELATLKPALLAGVVMRLTCLLVDNNSWPLDCYAVLGEPSTDYDFPQSILCRLILTARVSDEFTDTYVRYGSVVEHAISLRPGWIESQAVAANEVAMLGNRVF
uniref:Fungal_trans domain-containing protein n=1 Tax=Angiostrongylus cantonensis TaxID=6313 RepID=A0A158P5S7_ANGCA